MDTRAVTRLSLLQYKSIEECDIELSPLTVLVGRNGVGKSNIIDALRFVADALRNTLDYAIRERGGIDQVRRRVSSKPTRPGIRLDLQLPAGTTARYSFLIADVKGRNFRVERESCDVFDTSGNRTGGFNVSRGAIVRWDDPASPAPAVVEDRLLLVAASGSPTFRPVFDVLTRMVFHNLNPEVMKYPQRPEAGDLLAHDGGNLASVVKRLESTDSAALERVRDYLNAVGVPVTRIRHKRAGALETVEVAQRIDAPTGTRNPTFDAVSLSDGTVRALGIFVSLVSARGASSGGPSLVGIEEPETALHPAAAGAMMEALGEGAERTQLIVTSHSPDLLDDQSVSPAVIRPVLLEDGRTVVGRLDPAKAALMTQHLATAGELLRLDQLEPDPEDLRAQAARKGTLWEGVP